MTGLPARSRLAATGVTGAPMKVRESLKVQRPQSRQIAEPSGCSMRSRRVLVHR